jgi:hypothetical protein
VIGNFTVEGEIDAARARECAGDVPQRRGLACSNLGLDLQVATAERSANQSILLPS